MKFCDPKEYDVPIIMEACEKAGLRLLTIEIDQQAHSFEQIRTRVQSFVESMEAWVRKIKDGRIWLLALWFIWYERNLYEYGRIMLAGITESLYSHFRLKKYSCYNLASLLLKVIDVQIQ